MLLGALQEGKPQAVTQTVAARQGAAPASLPAAGQQLEPLDATVVEVSKHCVVLALDEAGGAMLQHALLAR